MRILLLNQFFWPDTAATGQLLSDVASHLASSGDAVDVICGSATYGGTTRDPQPGVRIIRLRNTEFSHKALGRMGSYVSFLAGALWHGLKMDAPDVVVTLTTPPLLSLIGLAIQKLGGARHIIWEMDVYPDVATDLGVLRKSSVAARFFGWLADLPRRRADRIIVLGECMRSRLLDHGIPAQKLLIAENWAEKPEPRSSDSDLASLPFPPGPLSIVYSGNFGLAHDVDTIARAILELPDDPANRSEFRFVFAGGGSRNGWLKSFCTEHRVNNVSFLPYCEREALGTRLASGHIGLVTQKAECLGSAVPSKTYGIMAAGRPILFIGPKESTPARIIERYSCGWQVECGDVSGLVNLLKSLDAHRELVSEAGARAKRAFLTHYQRSVGVARIAAILGSKSPVSGRVGARAVVGQR